MSTPNVESIGEFHFLNEITEISYLFDDVLI